MAKLSKIVKNEQRLVLIKKYAARRAQLKKQGDYAAYLALDKLPKNACPVRYRNRCKIDGRPRGYLRLFGMSRILARELLNKGEIPGFVKV